MKCPTCSTPMKPLLTSMYCPNEDRHEAHTRAFTGGVWSSGIGGPPSGHFRTSCPDMVNAMLNNGWLLTAVDGDGYTLWKP